MRASILAWAVVIAAFTIGTAESKPVMAIGKLNKNPQQFKAQVTRHCYVNTGVLAPDQRSCPASDFAQIGAPCTCMNGPIAMRGVVGR
jgi:hypothetical protein